MAKKLSNSSHEGDQVRDHDDDYTCGECMKELQGELIGQVVKGVTIKIDEYYISRTKEITVINKKLDFHRAWLVGLTVAVLFLLVAFFFLFSLYDKLKYLKL
jgi:hypothetical protein